MIRDDERRKAVGSLVRAEKERSPVPPLTKTYPHIDAADAYEIQRQQVRNKIAAGHRIRGHKVGLSSTAMQKMMGVSEPAYGHLLDSMFVYEGAVVRADSLCQPKVGIEVAFVLDRPLPAPGCTVADVLTATGYVAPVIEIIDSRIEEWNIRLADAIADNASSAKLVLGARKTPLDGLDLRTLGALLRKNGEIVETGAAGAALGHPAIAISWLANKVHESGATLDAGHVILPGMCTRAVDVAAGDAIIAEFDELGPVSVRFA